MTEMMLQRAVTTHQNPVGPMPEAKLDLYTVSAQMKVAVSCDCNMTNFHEDCYGRVNSTSIQAKATFSFEYHSCNGVY
ncbi:hypothetical protein CEP53_013492 [Fusarium sp. AF-6]|nr:hypothetical protein CEP53_013492 [Fusarium sp. AF-6]